MCFLALHKNLDWEKLRGVELEVRKTTRILKSSLRRTQKELYTNPTFLEWIIGMCLENLKLNEFYYLKEGSKPLQQYMIRTCN